MFVRVDLEENNKEIEGFTYFNKDGDEESVVLNGGTVDITTPGNSVEIYNLDIPLLIKALEAAYKHLGSPT